MSALKNLLLILNKTLAERVSVVAVPQLVKKRLGADKEIL